MLVSGRQDVNITNEPGVNKYRLATRGYTLAARQTCTVVYAAVGQCTVVYAAVGHSTYSRQAGHCCADDGWMSIVTYLTSPPC